jgi:hypothetical protein
VHLTNQCL